MENKTVKWGVLCCARIADSAFIPGILSAQNAELYAISSKDSARLDSFSRKFSPQKAFTSYEALLDDPVVEVVYIPLPNGLHKQWVMEAAKRKKHVLCEKPLGVTAQEVEEMKRACDDNGVLLMEAFAYLHSPLTKTVHKMVQSGAIGTVRHIQSNFSYYLKERDDVRLQKKLSGGATYDIGCYNISLIRLLAGEPSEIYATGEVSEENVDESSCAVFRYDNGLTAVSHCSFNCQEWAGYTILGEDGAIDVPILFNTKGKLAINVKRGSGTETLPIDCPDNYMLEVEQFSRCILEEETPFVSYEFSLGNAKVIDGVLKRVLRPE